MLTMSSYSCFIFHPYLVSFPFYAIPICPPFRNPQIFLFTCLHSFLYMVVMGTIVLTYIQTCVLLLLSLTGEEMKSAEGYFCCHGNNCKHIRTKFHLHMCYSEQVIGVKK